VVGSASLNRTDFTTAKNAGSPGLNNHSGGPTQALCLESGVVATRGMRTMGAGAG